MSSDWDLDLIAQKRKEQIETGLDITFNEFFVPYYRNLLIPYKPKCLIDIGCGTGHLLLELADSADRMVGIEPSTEMINVARQVLKDSKVILSQSRIEDYYPDTRFDFAISHLCLQAVENVKDVLSAVGRILQPGGVFIFVIPHPCFWNSLTHFIPDDEYRYLQPSFSFGKLTVQGDVVGMVPYYHRPLQDYFQPIFQSGFQVVRFDEIHPDTLITKKLVENWQVPRYVIFHCQRVEKEN